MLVKFFPLVKYRNFRLLFLGQLISFFGTMLTYVALPFQVYQLSKSSLAVGLIGIVQLIPLLITSLYGGALADLFNRKKLLLFAILGALIASVLLLTNSQLEKPSLTMIYIAAALASAIGGFYRPTLQAIEQSLIEKRDMAAVASLNSLAFSIPTVLGPAFAGLLLVKYNVSMIYFINFLTYLAPLLVIAVVDVPQLKEKSSQPVLQSIYQGFNYAFKRQELLGSYLVDFIAMVFGMPMALFPAIAETFHNTVALGWLYAAPSTGMLIISLFSGWTHNIKRQGAAISYSAIGWGVAIIFFGLTQNIYWALFFLVLAGVADGLSGIFRMTLWNQTIPHHYRGRLAGIEMISYMSGPLLGNAEAGLIAHYFGIQFSIISGGVLCVMGVILLVLWLPKFWVYSSQESPEISAVTS